MASHDVISLSSAAVTGGDEVTDVGERIPL
jgi:hypothetical protein